MKAALFLLIFVLASAEVLYLAAMAIALAHGGQWFGAAGSAAAILGVPLLARKATRLCTKRRLT
jgi:hypothetical protein